MSVEGISVVLLVRDAEHTLGKSLGAWQTTLNGFDRPWELVVVDDGSRDGSVAIVRKAMEKSSRIRLIEHSEPKGLGHAVRTALENTTLPLVFYTVPDPAYVPGDLKLMLPSLKEINDLTGKAVGIVNGQRRGQPLSAGQRFGQRCKSLLVRIVLGQWLPMPAGTLGPAENRFWWSCRLRFGLRVGDINSAFKLFRRSVFDKMILQSEGDFIHAEILAKANFLGATIDETPLTDHVPNATSLPDMKRDRKRVFSNAKFKGKPILEAAGAVKQDSPG
jgi:glycosyltransferase involved in cell wall biosynthesis